MANLKNINGVYLISVLISCNKTFKLESTVAHITTTEDFISTNFVALRIERPRRAYSMRCWFAIDEDIDEPFVSSIEAVGSINELLQQSTKTAMSCDLSTESTKGKI
ncbi:hypothetical protein GCM10028858_21400 [Halorubrum pallidum]